MEVLLRTWYRIEHQLDQLLTLFERVLLRY